jgi:hypothetical protein
VAGKVSPVITFPRLNAKSWSAFSKSRLPKKAVIFKTPGAPSRKLPETPDEWRGRVSPVHVFPRFRFSNGTTRQNFAGFLKMTRLFETPAEMQKIRHFETT